MKNTEDYIKKQQAMFLTPIDFANITVEKIHNLVVQYLDTVKTTNDHIAQVTARSFTTVIQPQINLDISTQCIWPMVATPMNCHPDQKMRDASFEAIEEIQKFIIDQNMREDVYNVFIAYYNNEFPLEKAELTIEECRCVERIKRNYTREGVTLKSQSLRDESKKIQQRLEVLQNIFLKNLNDDNTTFEFTKNELDGMPDTWFNEQRQIGDNKYQVRMVFDTDVAPILNYCNNRNIRQQILRAYNSLCKLENTPLAVEILQLRQRLATLLGYNSFADYVTEFKMTKNAVTVRDFLQQMQERFKPLQKNSLDTLRDFARIKLQDPNFNLDHYDVAYFRNLYEAEFLHVDHKIIQQYFSLDHVVRGTLDVFAELLSLKFKSNNTIKLWHEDVKLYEMYDLNSNELLGSFILDLSTREGKNTGCFMQTLITGSDLQKFTGIEHQRQNNLAWMLCNFSKNDNLRFDEVKDFFHEFGHLMHFMCSKAQIALHGGLNNLEQDFIEAPSQLFEQWSYVPYVLKRISSHMITGDAIPDALINNIVKAIHHHNTYKQLVLANFDLMVHMLDENEIDNLDLNAYWRKMSQELTGLPDPRDAIPANFVHIFAYSCQVGIYGYIYSKVIAIDMFESKFATNPMDKEAGMLYRKCILEPGSSKDANELVKDFLGRDFTLDAYIKHCGLNANDK